MRSIQGNKAESLAGAAIYQIFLRNFTEKGDFKSAADYLPGLAESGIDIVYLTPIHPIGKAARKGSMGSPYAVKDYTEIDPDLGTGGDFDAFVRKARDSGLRVMIDVVYNHCAPDSRIAIEHPEWCRRDALGRPSMKVSDWSDVIALDYSSLGLRKALIDALRSWKDRGVEGFRCDVAPLVPLDFWAEARAAVDPERKMAWLAETVHKGFVKYLRDAGHIAHGDPEMHSVFDMSYDYDGFEYLESYFEGTLPLDFYLNHLSIQETLYPKGALKLRCLENHDLRRAASLIGLGKRLECWTSFCQLLPGPFLCYMGQELALSRRPSLFDRDVIDRSSGDRGFESFFFKSLAVAKRIKAECGSFTVSKLAEGILRLGWSEPGAAGVGPKYTAILNLENRRGFVELKDPVRGVDCLFGGAVSLSGRAGIPESPLVVEESRE